MGDGSEVKEPCGWEAVHRAGKEEERVAVKEMGK